MVSPGGTGDSQQAGSDEEFLQVGSGVRVPLRELSWRFTGSGGPGGQHANTSNTRVEVRFDIASSPSLPEWARSRLLTRFGPAVSVVASDERSQARNRSLALRRLATRLAAALRVEKPRTPTKPTRASQRRRLEEKRRRGALKRERGSRGSFDE